MGDQGHLKVHAVSTAGFAAQVADYEAGRPSYSQEALNHVLAAVWADGNASPKACLDVAAGTGKFTRLLAEHPMLAVEAVEPNDAMRQGFEAAQKGWNITRPICCQAGSATSLPFEDASFDLVSVAQAFHWFANEAAVREMHRVLRPQGLLVLLWNREDPSLPWQRELLDIFEPLSTGVPQYWQGQWRDAFANSFARQKFGVTEVRQNSTVFRTPMQCTQAQLMSRWRSRSYVAVLPPDEQAAVMQRLSDLLDQQGSSWHAPQPVSADPGWELEEAHAACPDGPAVIDVVLCTEVVICRAV